MDKAITMGKLSAKGGFNLFLGLSLSSTISALGTILLARILTPAEYGLYAVALMPSTLIILFRELGMNFAMIKYLSQYRSEDRRAEIRSIITAGVLFESASGIILSLICFFFAAVLAVNVFHRPEIEPLIRISSSLIFGGSLLTAAQSVFVGFERMELNSFSLICQSVLKYSFAPLLAFLGYGVFGAILGYSAGSLVAGIIGIVIVYIVFHRSFRENSSDDPNLSKTLRTMLKYGLPLAITAILGGFLLQFYNFMIAFHCSDLMIGNYKAAVNFSVLITFFATPISTVLFPAFSKLNQEKDMNTLRIVFQSSIKYAAFLTIPATATIMVLSEPLVFTLFGGEYRSAPLFLTMYSITFLYTALGSLSLVNFLNGQGKTKVTMKLSLTTLVIGTTLGFLLIPGFGIVGLIVTTLISVLPSLAIGLWWVRKHFDVSVDWSSSARILTASTIAAVTTKVGISQLNSPSWTSLVLGGTIFLITYLLTAPLIGAVSTNDVKNLRQMINEFWLLSYIFDFPLNLIEELTLVSKKT